VLKRFFKSEKPIKGVLAIFALLSLIFLAGILVTLLAQALPFLGEYPLGDFLTGESWRPTMEEPMFGMLPLLVSSLLVTAIALSIAVPLSLGTAIFLAEVAPNWLREIVKPIIELLAGIPSVVFGFVGMVLIAPFIKDLFDLPVGLTALNAGIILAFMAYPTMASLAEDALSSVPNDLREASLALGSNRWETVSRVVLPAARSGIFQAVLLGFGRIIGETMTVLMVAGGAAQLTLNPLKPVRPITATIAAEQGEAVAGSPHLHSLFMLALLLFIITLGFNILAERIKLRNDLSFKRGKSSKKGILPAHQKQPSTSESWHS
jgi:phosphate transport system permease protein